MPKIELEKVHFVHFAVPDMALDDANTKMRIGKIVLDPPILIKAKPFKSAHTKGFAFFDGKKIVQGKNAYKLDMKIEYVNDGLEAAKVLRMRINTLPVVKNASEKRLIEIKRQLRIVMFLTNSKSIKELKKAPVYIL